MSVDDRLMFVMEKSLCKRFLGARLKMTECNKDVVCKLNGCGQK